jgi:hypothetical protein
MEAIELTDWEKAKRANTISAYKNILVKYPEGKYAEMAEKIIIDKEVDAIMGKSYNKLPSAIGIRSEDVVSPEVQIKNKTSYTLTVRYSGQTMSKKIVLKPGESNTVTLKSGDYRVAASVNASHVRNYAGNEFLRDGNTYLSDYVIETSFGGIHLPQYIPETPEIKIPQYMNMTPQRQNLEEDTLLNKDYWEPFKQNTKGLEGFKLRLDTLSLSKFERLDTTLSKVIYNIYYKQEMEKLEQEIEKLEQEMKTYRHNRKKYNELLKKKKQLESSHEWTLKKIQPY